VDRFDDAQLLEKLREVLGKWPLYREFRYTGSGFQWLPEQIHFFCTQCGRQEIWRETEARDQRMRTSKPDVGIKVRGFRCRNCKEQTVHIAYEWTTATRDREGSFRKFGQWPQLEEQVSKELGEALKTGDDLQFYATALRLRNFGLGIAAMAYMRRVIENHMNEMLDILSEEARLSGPESQAELERVKTSRFADKLDYAGKLFPTHLTPDGFPNPFGPLYTVTSEALHNLSEEKAVELFDQCRIVFEYVFSTLRPHLKKSRDFKAGLRTISEAAAKSRVGVTRTAPK
jgi:predicted RNA-binding Zn-ribbon protein involved in translation (DUF1610 family)